MHRSFTITDAADALGVMRNALSELVNERRGISPEMALRQSKVFGGTVVWYGRRGGLAFATGAV
jgi:addiction module HigA family antidote